MTTKVYLRIYLVSKEPEMCLALEYKASQFKRHEIDVNASDLVWKLDEPLRTSDLIDLLLLRGWHQTDIGDALSEARIEAIRPL